MVGCHRQSRLVYTNITHIALSYRCTPRTEVAYTNCLASSLNIYIGKTPILNFSALSGYLFVDKKPYYNSSLSLNGSIDPTSIGL